MVSRTTSSVRDWSYYNTTLIASKRILWSELFLLTCFVTSVVKNTFRINLLIYKVFDGGKSYKILKIFTYNQGQGVM